MQHSINTDDQSLMAVISQFENIDNLIDFAENELFVDKYSILENFKTIKDKNKKVEFIHEYAQDIDIKSTTTITKDKKVTLKNEFVITFLDNFDRIVTDYKISNSQMRVILYLLKKMQYGNLLILKQASLCEALNMKKSNISTIFSQLKKKNILIEDSEKNIYINSNIFMKGLPHRIKKDKMQNLKASQIEDDKITKSY